MELGHARLQLARQRSHKHYPVAALLAATAAFSNLAAHAAAPPWHWFGLYCLLLLLNALSLAVIGAPPSFWRWLAREMPYQIATAAH